MLGERTPEGLFRMRSGLETAIARGLAYSPYADLLWFETQKPDLDEAKRFANAIHAVYPDKLMAYNLSPSFNWDKALTALEQADFQRKLGELGYRFQFITLAGFHSLNHGMFDLAKGFAERGLPAYVELQRKEFESEARGYTATRHQSFVGASYFDEVLRVVSGGVASTTAMEGSTEEGQFISNRDKVGKPVSGSG